MNKIICQALLAGIILFATGCKKDKTYKAERYFVNPSTALLKINYASLYTTNPGVQLSINDERVSNLITGRTPFPGGGFNTNGQNFADYLDVKPGSNTLKISIPKRLTNVDSIVLFTTTFSVESGKRYTSHVTDTFTRTKFVMVEDDINIPPPGTARFKFTNLMPNVPFIDLYYGAIRVATNIPYLGTSSVFDLPATPAVLAAWTIRAAGTAPTSTALATYSSANTLMNQRIYTAFALGYSGSTAANTRPYISFLLNR